MDITDKIRKQMHGTGDTKILSAQGQTKFMQQRSGFPLQNPIGDAMPRRYGKPRTNAERRKRHKAKYGTSKLPPRGTGLGR